MSYKLDNTDYYSNRGAPDFYNRGKEKPYPKHIGTDGGKVTVDYVTGVVTIIPARLILKERK